MYAEGTFYNDDWESFGYQNVSMTVICIVTVVCRKSILEGSSCSKT